MWPTTSTFGSQEKKSLVAHVASGISDGSSALVEVRLGSATAAPIGSFSVGSTGGWGSFRDIRDQRGGHHRPTHRVYLTFKSVGDTSRPERRRLRRSG